MPESTSFPTHSTDPLIIDTFENNETNNLGNWHGTVESLPITQGPGFVRLHPTDPDQAYHTQFTHAKCFNILPYKYRYLHVTFSGSPHFGISLTQNNYACDPTSLPYPETWDTIEAIRYTAGPNDIYVPLSHFAIDLTRVVSVSFGGFYTGETTTLTKVEVVSRVPEMLDFKVPSKLPSGTVSLRCTRPGSFAFGIDDGAPWLAQHVMDILERENILATFFVVGTGIRDPETNFSAVYKEMHRRGHQIALHSDSHRKLEALESIHEIDEEIVNNAEALESHLGIESRYFRPPYGTTGARTRQRLAAHIKDPRIINWSVDIEDWLWADTDTPERQRDAFFRDVRQGGNLAVVHFVSPTTVEYLPEIIQFVKKTKATIMRIDQCLEDPDSPPLNLS
ncbi:polysaccharide deacetylase family protein [Aspergillus tanneri]|uniref:NodB homology domain-containing protein n=1 Tax=Aspergillus tanneri TaxID=1220188 RepID=A0A5M9MFT3_9EURO|nr:uncharacterized protein ATNIH1004_007221 [Aspergillus tanneri]KAA8645801.1 hypothetical protein ATNIH1004_007221 [Aspergillus tanneri]